MRCGWAVRAGGTEAPDAPGEVGKEQVAPGLERMTGREMREERGHQRTNNTHFITQPDLQRTNRMALAQAVAVRGRESESRDNGGRLAHRHESVYHSLL